MSATYFASSGRRFNPPKGAGLPKLNKITGVLLDARSNPQKNTDGHWLIIRLMTDDDFISVYFAQDIVLSDDLDLLNSLHGRTITLRNASGTPTINLISIESEGSIRAELLEGVKAGNYKMEDLPALLEFSKGNDDLFEKWQLFKQQLENDRLASVREEVNQGTEALHTAIDRQREIVDELDAIYREVFDEKMKLLHDLEEALVLIQGEEYPQGSSRSGLNGIGSKNLVQISTGYNDLLQAIQMFRSQKGIFVICGDEIHKIHHAYMEDKGRVYLLGSAKEFNKRAHEKSRKTVDRILHLLYPKNHP